MFSRLSVVLGAVVLGFAAGCAPKPAPAPEPIYAEPVFDKYGNPSCRPPDQEIGGAYTAELPICEMVRQPGCEQGGEYADDPTICPPGDSESGGMQEIPSEQSPAAGL
ncbi:MAG: hypothetical protein WCD16_11275 [Paracoccaceae bacterium]